METRHSHGTRHFHGNQTFPRVFHGTFITFPSSVSLMNFGVTILQTKWKGKRCCDVLSECECLSFSPPLGVNNKNLFPLKPHHFFKKFCWTKVHFVGPLIVPNLDFVWPSPRVSKPGWFSRLHTYLLACDEPKGHVWCYTSRFHQKGCTLYKHVYSKPHQLRVHFTRLSFASVLFELNFFLVV